jgi:hypothetical protein
MGSYQCAIGCVADGQRRVVQEHDIAGPSQPVETMTTGSDSR